MSNNSIEVRNVNKTYDIKYTTNYGGIAKSGQKQVLKDINLDLHKGEIFGIIGRNGSGKSTLLKILSNIIAPETGTINSSGKIAGILELGMGFQQELSGRENIYVKCGMYGFSKNEINSMIDEIIDFSELGEQIDHPLKTYSSGMTAKLAFAVLIHIHCDILIVDEALSIGDAGFNFKCNNVFQKMKKEGKTIVIASHNMGSVEEICDRVLWLDEGKINKIGEPHSICYEFENSLINSFDTVKKIAETGDVISQDRLGIMYRDGKGITKDIEKAKQWFKKAAESGYSEAQLNLADLLYKNGDITEATELYKKAANANNSIAITRLNDMDKDETEILNEISCEVLDLVKQGNLRATKLYADMLYNGNTILKNQKEAIKYYIVCANFEDYSAQYILGQAYRDGIGVEKDIKQSIKWFTKAASNGYSRARVELANIYRKGIGVDVDMNKAILWYTRAAECNDSNAMLQLGLIYRDGIGIDPDVSKSNYWMKKYSITTRIVFEYKLADIYKSSYLDERRGKCIRWFKDAAINNHANSAYYLGSCYRDGIGVTHNSEEALKWYLRGVELYNTPSMIESANMYLRGNGCDVDTNKAIELMEKASNCGNTNASLQLAKIQMLSPDSSIEKILTLLKKSSENANVESKALMSVIENKL